MTPKGAGTFNDEPRKLASDYILPILNYHDDRAGACYDEGMFRFSLSSWGASELYIAFSRPQWLDPVLTAVLDVLDILRRLQS